MSQNKKKRRRRRRKKRPRDEQTAHDDLDYVVVGSGEYCAITIPVDGGKAVIHRFETREEAAEQSRKNILQDQPLVDFAGDDPPC